jgi:hypothetical protein
MGTGGILSNIALLLFFWLCWSDVGMESGRITRTGPGYPDTWIYTEMDHYFVEVVIFHAFGYQTSV